MRARRVCCVDYAPEPQIRANAALAECMHIETAIPGANTISCEWNCGAQIFGAYVWFITKMERAYYISVYIYFHIYGHVMRRR